MREHTSHSVAPEALTDGNHTNKSDIWSSALLRIERLIGEEKPQNWSGTEAEMTLKEIFHSWFADSEIQADSQVLQTNQTRLSENKGNDKKESYFKRLFSSTFDVKDWEDGILQICKIFKKLASESSLRTTSVDTRSTSFNTEHKYDRSSEVLTNNDVSSPNTKSQLYQCLKILLQLLFKDTSKKTGKRTASTKNSNHDVLPLRKTAVEKDKQYGEDHVHPETQRDQSREADFKAELANEADDPGLHEIDYHYFVVSDVQTPAHYSYTVKIFCTHYDDAFSAHRTYYRQLIQAFFNSILSTDAMKVLKEKKFKSASFVSSLSCSCFSLKPLCLTTLFNSCKRLQNSYFLQLQAKYESFETTASWTARAAEIEPDCADSGEIQTQTDYLSSNSPSFAEEDSPNTGNPFKPPPASLFVHGANASEDADNDRTGKANGFCTPENDWHATPSLNAVKDFTDILAYMYTQEILSKLENPVSTANQDDFLPATRDESKEHFAHLEFEDWQNFSRKFEYSSDLDRPFQLPCYDSACEGKAIGAPLAHDTDELQEILNELKSDYEYLRPPPTEILCYTIPRYPDNHNPLLPLALQKKLDEMAPREFLTYVLKELTLEERESLMVDERQRRKSFLVNWPHSNNLSGVKLAQAGFYCVDNYDRVQCVFCRGSLHHWERDDNPMTEHARSFNFCRFVKGLECGNREYKSDVLTAEELKNINFYGDPPEMKKNRDGSVSTDSRSLGISTNRADTIQYAPEASRLRTYARWPASSPVTARALCEAGFYFTGFDDQVRCFYCSGGLRSWQTSDDPWEEHARWFPECSFLLQQKGEDYVTEVHNRTPANKKCTRSTESQKREEKKTKQDQSNYQAMVEFCIKMGHSETVIREAVRRNGRRFSNPDAFLDAIYSLDDPDSGFQEGDDSMDYSVMPAGAAGKLTNQPVSVPEEDARRYRSGEMQTDGAYSGLLDATSNRKCPPACCIMCFRKANIIETATQLGLPCGHVIYCDRCSKEERTRTNVNKHYKSKCPYFNCGAPLTGTFKFYIN